MEPERLGTACAAATIVSLALWGTQAVGAPTTYTLMTLTTAAGSKLDGALTIDDADHNNAVVLSEIGAWIFTFTSPNLSQTTIAGFGAPATSTCPTAGCFSVSPAGLSMVPSDHQFGDDINLKQSPLEVEFHYPSPFATGSTPAILWTDPAFVSPAVVPLPLGNLLIGSASQVPEPSSLMLLAGALLAGAIARSRR